MVSRSLAESRIQKPLLLQVFINLRLGKGGINTKVFAEFFVLGPRYGNPSPFTNSLEWHNFFEAFLLRQCERLYYGRDVWIDVRRVSDSPWALIGPLES